MCGRYAFFYDREKRLAQQFGVTQGLDTLLAPSWNIAPQQPVAVIRQQGEVRAVQLHRFGLLPFWAKDTKISNKLINARAETVFEKPAFRAAVRARRCIIPADGFYEWCQETRQPYFFSALDGQLLGFAGLWEQWTDRETGEVLHSAAIVTTTASEALLPIHHRMPLVLTAATAGQWLSDRFSEADMPAMIEGAHRMPIGRIPVSREVNRPANNHAGLVLENSA